MAKRASNYGTNTKRESKPKRTSIGNGFHSRSMMNKHKRRSFKAYRGQGRP
jgi:hypothetical protein